MVVVVVVLLLSLLFFVIIIIITYLLLLLLLLLLVSPLGPKPPKPKSSIRARTGKEPSGRGEEEGGTRTQAQKLLSKPQ